MLHCKSFGQPASVEDPALLPLMMIVSFAAAAD